jgi:hypothetical protein
MLEAAEKRGLSMSNGAFAFFAMTLSTISVALLAVLVFSF